MEMNQFKSEFEASADKLYDDMAKGGEAHLLIFASSGKQGLIYLKGNPSALTLELSHAIERNETIKDMVALAAMKNHLEDHKPSEKLMAELLGYVMGKMGQAKMEELSDTIMDAIFSKYGKRKN